MKKVIKFFVVVIILLFVITYLNKENNYQTNTNVISDEAIKRFESDLKEGVEIDPKNYITPKKDYNNKASLLCLKISKAIEKGVNIVLKKLLESLTE